MQSKPNQCILQTLNFSSDYFLNLLKQKQNSNPPIVSQATTITQAQSNQTSQLPPMTTSTGKLDLANVMKLCGIMDDDDFMDTDEMQLQPPPPPPPPTAPPAQCTTSYEIPTSLSTTQPSDSDGRPNALYLDGARPIDENSRWLTIPCVQNSDITNNRVSNDTLFIVHRSSFIIQKSLRFVHRLFHLPYHRLTVEMCRSHHTPMPQPFDR